MKKLKLDREQLTQNEKKQEYAKGHILCEPAEGTIAFKLWGADFTSTKKRVLKGKRYSFKSRWHYNSKNSLGHKLMLIATNKVHKFSKESV